MVHSLLKWLIVTMSFIHFGYMFIDGLRGIIYGDYFRPGSGEYKGQLGPWSKAVRAIGINPESTLMMSIFVVLGILGLMLAIGVVRNTYWTHIGLLILSFLTLWYLIPGTVLSILIIVLLIIKIRA